MAFSMVVIAALVGAGGLGQKVLAALQRLRVGERFEARIAIVILAIILDRISQVEGEQQASRVQAFRLLPDRWHHYLWEQRFEQWIEEIFVRCYRWSNRAARRIAQWTAFLPPLSKFFQSQSPLFGWVIDIVIHFADHLVICTFFDRVSKRLEARIAQAYRSDRHLDAGQSLSDW